jgi:GNAT superfamily N-acetyltransferase
VAQPVGDLTFRDGGSSDLADTFALANRTMHEAAVTRGFAPQGHHLTEADQRADWLRQRSFIEFIAAQPGCFVIAESGDEGLVGYARAVQLGAVEQMTELMVKPERQGSGIGRLLLERCWPGAPTPELGRVVVATGAPSDLTLYTNFGVMPVAGHWHLRQRTDSYREQRSQEDQTATSVHVLKPDRAVSEWRRLEPGALGQERSPLHEFFARDRTCLASLDATSGEAQALCWVSSEGEIGPAVAGAPGDLVPVVLSALDRVAMTQEPEHLSVYVSTLSWWLLRRLRRLGFVIFWPSWVMCSEPLPGLDRYMPTRPPHLL